MQQFARNVILLVLLAPASGLPLFGHSFRPVLSTKLPDSTKLPQPVEKPQNDVEAIAQQEEASIEQVEADLKRLDTFGASVTKDLEAQAHAVACRVAAAATVRIVEARQTGRPEGYTAVAGVRSPEPCIQDGKPSLPWAWTCPCLCLSYPCSCPCPCLA